MKIHHLPPEAALRSLHSQATGLTDQEACRRLLEYGPNRLREASGPSIAGRFLHEFTHFFALMLWCAAALAFFTEWREPGEQMDILGWAIVGVILINGCFSFWQEYRAERAVAALQRLLPLRVKVMRGGALQLLKADGLVPGDVVMLQEGDHVPADCRLIETFGIRVNNATVTGESRPQARDAQVCREEAVIHARNVLLAGTSVVSGEGRAVVFHTGMYTEFGRIAALTQRVGETLSPLQQEIVGLSRMVGALALCLGVVFFFLGQAAGLSFWQNFIFAIGIIVANVPEGLLPTVTLSLAMATQRMARRQVLIRHLPAVETLGSATVICTDKTGTLTQNRMAVRRLFLNGGPQAVDGVTSELVDRHRPLFECARYCQELKQANRDGGDAWLGDPMEIALVELASRWLPDEPGWRKISELPFDTERKRMTMVYATPRGRRVLSKGALEKLLPFCASVLTVDGVAPMDAARQLEWQAAEAQMAEAGLRVLAFAYRDGRDMQASALEEGLILTGLVALEDPPRPEVPPAIRRCREAGIRVVMVTGDHPRTAVAIARQVGMVDGDQPFVLTGEELRRLSGTQLQLALDHNEVVFARLGADQKMRIVEALQRKGQIVAVTGDGVNDAPALKTADIGIAMGVSGTDVAKEAADMILLDDSFAGIVSAIEEGRAVFGNLRKFIGYILTSNVPEILPYLAFALFGIPLPLTIVQILLVDLGTDMLPALGLGADAPEPGGMLKAPRPRREKLLKAPLILHAYLFLGLLEAGMALAAYFFVLHQAGWTYGQALAGDDPVYRQATTACLSAIIVSQIVNVFLSKHPDRSWRRAPLFDNRLILVGVAVEIGLILLVDYTPLGQRIFGTAPIGLEVWGFILILAPVMALCEIARRWLWRPRGSTNRRHRAGQAHGSPCRFD